MLTANAAASKGSVRRERRKRRRGPVRRSGFGKRLFAKGAAEKYRRYVIQIKRARRGFCRGSPGRPRFEARSSRRRRFLDVCSPGFSRTHGPSEPASLESTASPVLRPAEAGTTYHFVSSRRVDPFTVSHFKTRSPSGATAASGTSKPGRRQTQAPPSEPSTTNPGVPIAKALRRPAVIPESVAQRTDS
jgi:hypothetical protein